MNIHQDLTNLTQDKQIKNAVIDLLHHNEDVTHAALSKATGLNLVEVQHYSDAIQTMLTKLKKVHLTPNFKP